MLSEFKGRGGAERYKKYDECLSLIAATTEDYIDWISKIGIIKKPSREDILSISKFDLFASIPFLRELIQSSLSFFVQETVSWDKNERLFVCSDDEGNIVGRISKTTYPTVRYVILESNFIAFEEDDADMEFASEKARSIFQKIKAGRKRKRAASKGTAPKLTEIISSVSVRSNSYNLLNIWDLSISQLYDQFIRINQNYQLDVYSQKWAAWGTEPFDFSLWYTNNIKEDTNG